MSNDTVTAKQQVRNKVKLTLIGVAVLGFVAGAGSQLTVGNVAANGGGSMDHGSGSWHDKSGKGMESSLVIDAFEAYYASQNPGINVDTAQVTKLAIEGDNAIGMMQNGDSGARFFAHKVGGSWQIVFSGQMNPPQNIIDQYDIPGRWLEPDFNF